MFSQGGGGELGLLQKTSQTIQQMAEIAQATEINKEELIFYSHLRLHCMRFEEYVTRVSQAVSQAASELISNALYQLGSLIPETGLQELPSSSSLEFRFNTLNFHWIRTKNQDHKTKLEFVGRWLKLGLPKEHLSRVDRVLEECADMLDKQQPESSLKSAYDFLPTSNNEPSYVVWKAAQALFDALQKCKDCDCLKQHEFGAKLELGTYRRPAKQLGKIAVNKSGRVPRTDRDGEIGKVDFEMFLSREQEHVWHEIRVQTVKERVVGFAVDGQVIPSHEDRKAKRIDNLCKPINSMRSKEWQRLVLKLTSGHLFSEGTEKSNFWVKKSIEPISLLRCFEERHEFFTEKTKRILSLIIGYAVLHLHDTSWLQTGWGSANIKFFQTTNHKTPLRPFIHVQLLKDTATASVECHSEDGYDTGLDEFDSGHRCPALIALAVVLIEIYFAKPFTKLAKMSGIPLENPDGHITLLDVDQVFNGEEENKVEGWRTQIPEDSPLLIAIDNCLNPELWEDEEGNSLDKITLKSRIYQHVARLLEIHLTSGFSKISVENVDHYARDLDFGQWGHSMDGHEPQINPTTLSPGSLSLHRIPSPAATLLDSMGFGTPAGLPEFQKLLHRYSQASSLVSLSSSLISRSSLSNPHTDYRGSHFFDDEIGDMNHSIAETKQYLKWRSEYEKVYEKFISAHLLSPPPRPVKIAILDTGIDRDHHAFEAREENIKAKLNCYNNAQKNIPDLNGHGTFAAGLILDYAPDAELYIAKIADKENATPNANIVVDAINHAIDNWNVDIISLSFGWPSTDFEGYDELEDAIDRAYGKKVLIFAAASNSGGRLGRAYPASSSQVICVHSTNTLGTPSDFSPTAEPDNLNFATVGESVESAWPMLLCHDLTNPQRYVKSRSGTSYATPIMAGIAAFLLQYARLHLPEKASSALKRKEKMEALLKRCAERGPNYAPRGKYYYVELSLNQHNMFGRELDRINIEFLETLKR
ncbi:peptidase S8/S53 domain-containing protein [Trichoderma chlorosporum]